MGKKSKTEDESGKFVDIDVDNIDDDIAEQPGLRRKWGRILADAKMDLADREADLELVKAEIGSEIRKKPKKHGLPEKPTEGAIKEALIQEQEYLDANAAVNRAQREVNYIQASVIALDHRKSMLGDMVELISMGWFSDVKVRESAREAKRDLEQRNARKHYRRKEREQD